MEESPLFARKPVRTPFKMSNVFGDSKNVIIVILSGLLILSILGIPFLNGVFHWLQQVLDVIFAFFGSVLYGLSYSTGEVINVSSVVASDAAKVAVDVSTGALSDVGNILKGGNIPTHTPTHKSKKEHMTVMGDLFAAKPTSISPTPSKLDESLQHGTPVIHEPTPDSAPTSLATSAP